MMDNRWKVEESRRKVGEERGGETQRDKHTAMETKKFSRPDDRLTVFAPRGVQSKKRGKGKKTGKGPFQGYLFFFFF